MISFLQPLPVGNAVRVLLAPPDGALVWRLLRKATNDIVDQSDAAALLVYEGDDPEIVDVTALTNGAVYYYQPFYKDIDGAWSAGVSVPGSPASTIDLEGVDPLSLVRDRLEAGLKALVGAGKIQHKLNYVPVLTAPPTFEGTAFPIVTVHLTNVSPVARGLGELVVPDERDPYTGDWTESEGWMVMTQLNIVSWVVGNADVRIALRKAIARILLGNLPVFAAAGLNEVEFTQTDVEDLESFNAPIYETITAFSCWSLLAVDAATPPIVDVSALGFAIGDSAFEAVSLPGGGMAILDFTDPNHAVLETL